MSKPIPPINLMFDHKHDKRQQKGRVTRSTAGLLPFFLLLFVSFFISFTTKAQLTASFTADDTSGCAPVIVHFTNTSTNATSYFWDLGNGNTSTLKDAAGTYAAAGTYTVTLTAFAGSASKTYTMTVNAYAHPVVIFSSATRSVCPGIPVSFTNSSVANCWGTLSYKWSFGEGGSSTSATPAYAYTSPGSYTVTLLASNNGGCVSSTSMSNYIFVNTPAAISFGVSSGFICKAPGSVSFTNLTTGAAPINYTWRFGDGGTSGLKTPSHSYTTPNKTYDVTLIAQDGNGCVDSLQKPGFVSTGKLTANFSAPHDSCQFVPLTFYNTSTTHTTSKWTFGDGTKATGDTVKHNYLATGTYNVKLVITDGTCADSITKTVTIGRPTGSSFVVTPVGACSGIRSRTFTASMPAGTTASWISNIHGSMGTGNPLTFNYPVGGVIDGITLIVTDKFGCKDSLIDIKDTVASLVALISGKPFEGCVPLTANFTPEVFGKAYTPFGYYPPDQIVTFPYPYAVASYLWDFGDGSPKSMLATPVHTYTAEGAYDVYCEVTTVNGCKILALTPARAGATVPVASFTMDRNRTCSGQPTTFTSTSTGTITDYAWAFDTLGDSHAKDTVFKFTVPGIHEVRLEVSNNGCVSSRYKLLDTIDSPGARIVYKYTCIPVNGVAFSDTLNGDNTHLWQFGDGATSTANSPVHLFPALQTYSVTLTTYNAATGCRDTNTIDVSLERITARLTPDHSTICKDRADTITAVITHVLVNKVLSGKKSLALEKYTTRTQWYFNNVAIDTGSPKSRPEDIKSPIGDTARIFINRFGRDTAMLITTSNWGCLDTTKVEIIAAKPKANFSNTPAGGCAPLPVTFKDLSTDAPGTSLTNFTWAFGSDDPVTVTTSSIVHPYSASGTYTVTEYVTDNIGCSDTITKTNVALTINNPKAAFSVNAKTCVGLTSKFDNLSTAGTFLWKFGDGATSTASVSPVFHTYSVAGVYDVTLIITNAGCRDTMFVPGAVTVNVVPKASFTLSDSFAVCPPLSVDFNNTTTGATSYVWTFGDGSFSAATSPSDIYTAIGKYRIKLQAVNQYGCVDTAVANASIFGYAGAFTYSPLKVCTSSPVHFKALVSGVIKVKWDFSDGIIDSSLVADTISHSYLTAKSYVPKLILTDGAGCTSISAGADTIRVDTLVPGLSINPNPACQNNSVAFADSSYSFSSASTAWLWQFGNGATSTLKSPAYTYTTSATYTVTLSVTNGTGCKGKVTRSLKITPPPGIVMGALALCAGQTTTLSNATGGGKWTSGNSTIATIDSVTGVVNAVGAGNVSIQYKLSSGCFAAATLTVNPMPDTILAGTHKVCETYTYTLSDRTSGGTWTSSNTAAATINPSTGVIKGIAANTTIITYQLGTGCYAATTVTIDRTPAVPVGPTSVCVGTTIVLSDLDAGGTWSSGDVSLATIGSATGVVTGVVSGSVDTSVVIVYTLPSGCPSSVIIKVNPALPPITGPRNVCVGSTTTLSDASLGGTWSSANTTIASVLFGVGTVKGVSQGTTTITYTSVKGCTISTTVTVDTLPPPISGIKDVCAGSTTLLSDASPAGTWSTSATIVTVGSSTGIVTGIKAGTAAITYTIATGCKIPATVTVNPLPAGIGITTFSPACAGGNPITILDVTAGGVWSSGNTTILTVVSTGSASADLKGVSAGTAVVTYMLSTGCFTSRTFTVVSLQPPVTSTPEFCAGNTITLTDTGGGTWSSANTIVATVGISSGIVNGLSSGTATITYLIASSGCRATIVVTVDPVPPNIAAVSRICVNDSAFFSDAMPGGAWSSSAIAIATVNTAGIVKGLAAGTATITYMMTTGCFKTASVSINPLPGAIKGKPDLCADTWTQLSDAIGGGWQWTSGNTVVARIDPMSGIVFGNNPGTATITYTLSTGCATTAVVTVNPVPAAVTGTVYVCLGDTAVLSDITTGGTWSSSSPGIAFVPSDTGVVSSISAGTATVTYTLATGCLAVTSFTVYPLPSAITGSTRICLGAANILSDLIPGTWSSSDVSIASVDGSGAVTGMALGTADITFTSAGNCKAMTTVTVYPVLAPLVGDTIVCIGVKATLSEAVPGGVWSSTDTNIAVIDTAGVLTGRATGTTIISYTLANSCDTAAMELFVFPQPYADTIKGSDHVCTRASIQLSNSVKGGVWTSSNNLLAMVDTAGIVTGVAQGMDTIYYTYTNRCGTDMTSKAILISQAATSAQIIIHPDTSLCSNIMFMNFGADSPEPPGGHYVWSADNAVVYAVSADKQNCLITFPWPGISIVRLTSQFLTSDCASEEGLTFHISNEESPVPQVVYYEPELVCMDHTADSYQWGYDDVKTLDSVIINGAVNQNYYEPKLEVTKKNYWVLTYHDGCLQKSYYNTPTGVVPGPGDDLDIKLYPNPADASVNMEVSGMRKSDRIGFKLYDILGKERSIGILEAGKGSIQLADSPAGVYMVLFTKNGVKIGTRVFVKK